MRAWGKEDKTTTKKQLPELIATMFCQQDFSEWLEEMKDIDTLEIARDNICEALSALQIQHLTKQPLEYYQEIVRKHSIETEKIISFEEMENRLLLALFTTWIDDENKAFRDEIAQRLPYERRDREGLHSEAEDYYLEICYYEDDIRRLGWDNNTSYDLWFKDEESYIKRLRSLLAERAEVYSDEIESFVHYMFTLDGLLPDGKKHCGYYRDITVPRKYLIWLSSVYEVFENDCYGRENHRSLLQTASSMSSQELKWAGYEGTNFRNCLDVYCAFSAYNYMRNNLPKRMRIWPGRKLHGKRQ